MLCEMYARNNPETITVNEGRCILKLREIALFEVYATDVSFAIQGRAPSRLDFCELAQLSWLKISELARATLKFSS